MFCTVSAELVVVVVDGVVVGRVVVDGVVVLVVVEVAHVAQQSKRCSGREQSRPLYCVHHVARSPYSQPSATHKHISYSLTIPTPNLLFTYVYIILGHTLVLCSTLVVSLRKHITRLTRSVATGDIGILYLPKSGQINFSWSNNDVITAIELIPQWVLKFYTSPKNFWLRPWD